MSAQIRASRDRRLAAQIVAKRSLLYEAGADLALDRCGYVRAASGVAFVSGRLAIVQDDANFVALYDPVTHAIAAITLPAGLGGARQFDKERGNKKHKLDFEACFAAPFEGSDALYVVGSGSSQARESWVLVTLDASGMGSARLFTLPRLYRALREHPTFAGSELNLEGAAFLGSHVRLFQRANGLPHQGRTALDATCDVSLAALIELMGSPESAPVPALERVRHYDLGDIDGVRLTFTDGHAIEGGRVLFLASAEASPNAIDDGEVRGTAVGVLEPDGSARLTLLRDEHDKPCRDKAEGIALSARDRTIAFVVFDPDDHTRASSLAEVRLDGF